MSEITPEAVKTARDAATPGPWAWRQHTTDGIEDVLEPYMCQSEGFIEVSGPNSRLIAMAPDLATAYLAQAEQLANATARSDELAGKLEFAVSFIEGLLSGRDRDDGWRVEVLAALQETDR